MENVKENVENLVELEFGVEQEVAENYLKFKTDIIELIEYLKGQISDYRKHYATEVEPQLYSAGGNEKLKNPYADYTLKFHAAFARDFSGIGFWAGGQYYGSPWYRRGYTRMNDTALVYPVENSTVPSRRLAAWHRGVQDLWLLRETALRYKDNAQIQAKLRKAAQSAVDYPNDHQRSEALRKYCRELLAAIKKNDLAG